MHIKILGTKGEIKATLPYHAKHSGILVDHTLLLDLGEKSYLTYQPKAILLTHFHPDHAYFVRWGKEENPPTSAPIYAPEKAGAKILSKIHLIEKAMDIEGYHVIPIPTHHSKNVRSQAYVISKGGKSFLYTGDLVWIDKQYHSQFDKMNLIITDGSFIRKGGMVRKDKESGILYGHNGIPNLIDLFKDYTKKMVFVHFGSWFYDDTKMSHRKIDELAKEKQMELIVGFDGQEIEL